MANFMQAGCIQSAYDLLRSNDYTVEGLLGHSKSGSGVLVHAAKYGNIPRVVVCSGRFNHQRGKHTGTLNRGLMSTVKNQYNGFHVMWADWSILRLCCIRSGQRPEDTFPSSQIHVDAGSVRNACRLMGKDGAYACCDKRSLHNISDVKLVSTQIPTAALRARVILQYSVATHQNTWTPSWQSLRFNVGVKERFGDDVFERVERDGGIPQTYKASWGVREWVFDKQVSFHL